MCSVILYHQLAYKKSNKVRKHPEISSVVCSACPPPLSLVPVFSEVRGRGWHREEDEEKSFTEPLSQLLSHGQAWNPMTYWKSNNNKLTLQSVTKQYVSHLVLSDSLPPHEL